MSKISYGTREEVERVAGQMRSSRLPCDVIHIDTDWFTENWVCDWKFDEEKFPKVEEMIAKLHQDGYSCLSGSFPILNGERPPMRFMTRRLLTDILRKSGR